ncbi:c-type cytochrome [Alkalicoccus saliphilus]|uniref:Cytochrome C551 n=1 Tax=Alkalicoccus saliphilus TaxID=200989 RepID=A0A2T4UAX4_9BACI|nr:cytochrome c [Alkalicoccus saliphilus]PTL40533.1 cytochrome C551 [Alkalicoccus saliphilus]
MRGAPLFPFAATALLGLLLVFALSLVGLNIGGEEAAENNAEEGNNAEQEFDDPIELGESVYEGQCASCHGGELEGGTGPALDSGDYDEETILTAIEEGPGSMPAGLVDGEEADAVAEFILSEN